MTRHYRQHVAQRDFEKNASRLRLELTMGTARRHLDVLVELLESNLRDAGDSLLAQGYAAELATLETMVRTRSNLRVVR